MTSELQSFIAVSDVKSIRIECPNCRTRTSFPLDSDTDHQRLRTFIDRFKCPHCEFDWMAHARDTHLGNMMQFIEGLFLMRQQEKSNGKVNRKLIVLLEVPTPTEPK